MSAIGKIFAKYNPDSLYSALKTYEEDDPALLSDARKDMAADYINWYNETFEEDPTWDYSSSVRLMQRLYELNPAMQKAYADPNLDIYQAVDY